MTTYLLESTVNRISYEITKFFDSSSYERSTVLQKINGMLSELHKEYGQVLGELKIKHPEQEKLLTSNSDDVDQIMISLSKITNAENRIQKINIFLSRASELITIGRTLENKVKNENDTISDINVRINVIFDRLNKIELQLKEMNQMK